MDGWMDLYVSVGVRESRMDLMADGYSAVIKRFEDGQSPPPCLIVARFRYRF